MFALGIASLMLTQIQTNPAGQFTQSSSGIQAKSEHKFDSRLVSIATEMTKTLHLPALWIAMGDHSQLVGTASVGTRRLGYTAPAAPDDRLMIASVSKVFTNAVIARLIEKGLLNWDSKVGDILPGLKGQYSSTVLNASVLQLMSHRAGLPREANHGRTAPKSGSFWRWGHMVEFLESLAIGYPGEQGAYSNGGPLFLACMAEKVTSKTFEDLMIEEVFVPLGLKNSGYGIPVANETDLTQPWPHLVNSSSGAMQSVSITVIQSKRWMAFNTAGGMYSSSGDMIKLAEGLSYQSQFLKKSTLDRIYSDAGGGRTGGGLAYCKVKGWYKHEGCTGIGDGTCLMINPTDGRYFVYHTNANSEKGGINMTAIDNQVGRLLGYDGL